jgi:hypothetical protein
MLTRVDESVTRMPIVIPIGVEMLNEIRRPNDLHTEKPDLAKVPPRETAATRLCKAMLRER